MTQDSTENSDASTIDARGLNCPLPVLKLNKALRGVPVGTEIELLATDRTALRDVPAFCEAKGYRCEATEKQGYLHFRVQYHQA